MDPMARGWDPRLDACVEECGIEKNVSVHATSLAEARYLHVDTPVICFPAIGSEFPSGLSGRNIGIGLPL